IAASIRQIPGDSLVLDGEIVLLDDGGRPTFQGLMKAYHGEKGERTPFYWAFDLLHLNGMDLRKSPLGERRSALEELRFQGSVRLLESIHEEGEILFEQATKLGFEGIVGKKLSSPYREGARSDDWVKIKGYHSEEFLVCGYTRGFGAREHTFGALLLGRKDGEGRIRFCGSVGGGFSDAELLELRAKLDRMRVDASPFSETVTTKGEPVFVRPELVAEVRFMSWTAERRLRFPVFRRLRGDLEEAPPAPALDTTGSDEADAVIEALERNDREMQITVEGSPIQLTSLDRQLWPGVTKRDLLLYLAKVSNAYLRHLRDRPLTMVRYPDGIEGEGFFQRHWEASLPEFVQTVDIWSQSGGEAKRHLLCNNLPTLLWLGQNSAIELHPWHSRVVTAPDAEGLGAQFDTPQDLEDSVLEYPDYLVCDLDPNVPTGKEEFTEEGWRRTVDVALALHDLLDSLKLRSFVKTTGKTGLHIFVPLRRIYEGDQVKEAARTIGRFLMEKMPSHVTMETRLNKRPRKVFFDANMNGYGRTLASAYSPRPVPDARVSMPVDWNRLPYVRPGMFTIATVPAMLAEHGDLWKGSLDLRQHLGAP
ncbi:MAG TPA: DNA ligase D, partial [Fimbriimonas sp.]